MNGNWNLNNLYSSFESPEFKADMDLFNKKINNYKSFVSSITNDRFDLKEKLKKYINETNNFKALSNKLIMYSNLVMSVNTKDSVAIKTLDILEQKLASIADSKAKLYKWIGSIDNLSEIINSSDLLKEHTFHLNEIKEYSKHILSDREELIIAQMKGSGSSSWTKLKDLETSSLLVDIEINGEKKSLPLSVVRNMAFDKDEKIRKAAYEAELKSYKKIENSVSSALNGIKGEVITISKLRGYSSPLEETVINSRLDMKSLNAMLSAMKESLPVFRKYYKRKAELLGNKNGLPFYNLFAPIIDSEQKFTFDEAKDFIIKNFTTFSEKLGLFAKNAIENEWIDVYPKEGKVGGAFCENLHMIGESRIMLNFGETLSDVITLAHELGHGYHGECLLKESEINSEYPMPIAETASTFCETIVKKAAVKGASKNDALAILETEISDCGQIIVDILSRFLFEKEVFDRRKEASLNSEELKEIMINAQKETYGDGLDFNYLHPYMWACKPHYYYAEANFYNFPYAFGLLFSKGLYAEYLKRGSEFVEDYDKLLSVTGKSNLADITKLMNIDIQSIDFWRNSLKIIEDDINNFLELSKNL
ncbi:pepF/M3 family oligoendopeptidase [Clostridium thermobutyricum]|uniref:PepF/M3 family oligoendopeptidase n=1 Tax=Clostridium thermobutyricum TaxID=29372 RepID=N9Y2T3_9CLOT|nr:M3 family oligoendopeptidase [Clostridium thermobutyricum]ENZ02122.1 pepF/M3 family oligoendopeptidase [Clostridium thermobutyricum]